MSPDQTDKAPVMTNLYSIHTVYLELYNPIYLGNLIKMAGCGSKKYRILLLASQVTI